MGQITVNKAEEIYQILRQDIVEVRLLPNTPLRLSAICERYQVGSTPLREALTRLEMEHLVGSAANKGFFVAPVSVDELADLTKTKGFFEIQLLRESMSFGNREWEANIVAAHYSLANEVSPLDPETNEENFKSWARLHTAFHVSLISANRAPWLERFYNEVADHMRRHGRALRQMSNAHTESAQAALQASPAMQKASSLEPHTELMDAVIKRQADKVEMLIVEHNKLTMLAYEELGVI
ncbi:DNA-binding GntR family transcriptional regulator [Pseudochrobactrum asaccharolyticum]|uniref:DNA-binding GntR family transcriptional regulator n=1 Tax=Pseudochrobactrum asaccharolyticum TaxID=354351 RepID=A0A366DQ76_9HYPH|nr:DNA-binding GntR family transcriptional regulator [Pseudochrobactrum asaccharolyticum]